MPTYEYQCRKCGHQFEKFQAMTATPVKTCPKCRGRVHRLLSGGAGIIFKGSGFYQTDYKKTAPPPAAKAEGAKAEAPKAEAPKKEPAKTQAKKA